MNFVRSTFFFSSRRRHTRLQGDWSSDVCSSDLRTSTRPFGSRVAFISIRGCDIGGPYRHWGVGADRSMISVVAVAGSPPPKIITKTGERRVGEEGRSPGAAYP